MIDNRQTLENALAFHGHRCWASVAGVRAGLAALRDLGVQRSGGRQLHAFIEIGEDHGGMCFGDGVQYATGCTLGKGNMDKTPLGKLAVTVVERATNRALRVSYKPTLQKRIGESPFMVKRGQGIEPDGIPEAEQMELVDLVWRAPETDVLSLGEVSSSTATGCPRPWASCPAPPATSSPPAPTCAWWATSTCASPARATNAEALRRGIALAWRKPAGHRPTQRVQSGETSLDGLHRATRSRTP